MNDNKKRKCLVLLSSFNGEKYIGEQLISIFQQKNIDSIDVVVRDDGSTDATIDIVESFIKKGFPIVLLNESNIGFVGSFIKLIDYAYSVKDRYDYFLLSDQDDVWMDDKIEFGISTFENKKEHYILYCSSSLAVDEELHPLRYKKKKYKVDPFSSVVMTFSPGHTYVFKDELLSLINNCDYKRIYAHDSFIYTVSSILGNVFYDEKEHTYYRQTTKNQIGTSNRSFIRWFKERLRRLKRGDFKKYGMQIQYIYDKYSSMMPQDIKNEIGLFLSKQKNFFTRLGFVFKTKIHRQSFMDNQFFKIAYLFGKYKN